MRSRLGLAVVASLLFSAAGATGAATVNPGQTVTVTPGSTLEGEAFSVNGGTLIVQNARTSTITGRYAGSAPASIALQNATVTGGGINSLVNSNAVIQDSNIDGRITLSTNVGASALPRSHVTLIRSTVAGTGGISFAASAGGRLDSEATLFNNRILVTGATVNLNAGTSVKGDTNGISVNYNGDTRFAENFSEWGLTIDGSSVAGTAGSAILVTRGSGDETVRITAQNGATLTGGNGVMIEARDNALLDFTARTSTLSGDITIADTATAKISLLNGLDLTGRILGPANVIVDQGGRWTLSGDSNTGNLTLGAGSNIFLGAAGTAAYPQLTVNGNYTGNGGTLHFNTVLAGDDAASSRVHVTGDTSGTTQVTVNNIAGAGAQTVNGIPLVQVDGTSNGKFTLQGRAIGGMHEYFLHKGSPGAANGNWYLTSVYTGNPCDINPSLPECTPVDPVDPVDPTDPTDPVPVLRPEPGAYLANQAAAVQMFQLRRHDRGEPGFDRARIGTGCAPGVTSCKPTWPARSMPVPTSTPCSWAAMSGAGAMAVARSA